MINITICDDNPLFLDYFNNIIKNNFFQLGEECNFNCFQDPVTCMNHIKNNIVDLIFLEIESPKMYGIEVAREIRRIGNECSIVFISSKDTYVFEAFEVNPFYYLRKQKIEQEIKELVNRYINKFRLSETNLVIKQDGLLKKISINSVIYFKSIRNNTEVYTMHHKYLLKESLSELEEKYSTRGFIRVDRGCIINAFYVDGLQKDKVILKNGEEVYISRRRYKEVKLKLQQFMSVVSEDMDFNFI